MVDYSVRSILNSRTGGSESEATESEASESETPIHQYGITERQRSPNIIKPNPKSDVKLKEREIRNKKQIN